MTSTCGQNGGSKFEKSETGKLNRYASNQEYIFFFEVPAPRQMIAGQNYPAGISGQKPMTEFWSNSSKNQGKVNISDSIRL